MVSALSLVSLCVAIGAVILASLTFSRNHTQSAHLIPDEPSSVSALATHTGQRETGEYSVTYCCVPGKWGHQQKPSPQHTDERS